MADGRKPTWRPAAPGGRLDTSGPWPCAAKWWRERIWRLAALGGLVAAPLVIYPLAAAVGGALAARLAPARQLPGRDPVGFYLLPPKTGYVGARAYGMAALGSFEPAAAVVADWLPYQTLRYLQAVEHVRPDVRLEMINAGGRAQVTFLLQEEGTHPLYLADASPMPYYELPEIEQCFALARQGVVYRLTPKAPRGACRN